MVIKANFVTCFCNAGSPVIIYDHLGKHSEKTLPYDFRDTDDQTTINGRFWILLRTLVSHKNL